MKTKLIIAGVLLALYVAKKEKTQASKLKADTEKLEFDSQLSVIQERIHDYLEKNLPFRNESEIIETVLSLTTVDTESEDEFEEVVDEKPF